MHNRARQFLVKAMTLGAAVCLNSPAGRQVAPAGAGLQGAQPNALVQLRQPLTLDIEDQRLADVIDFIARATDADIEPLWRSEHSLDGLDPDALVSLRVTQMPALAALERLLATLPDDFGEGATWQMGPAGAVQIGPRAALNRYQRTVIYDVRDLLMQTPDYPQALEIDLQSALQDQGGGGRPLRTERMAAPEARPSLEVRAREIERLLADLVEPAQWESRGGEGATVTHWRGMLIIRAADYIHRAIKGYR